MAYYPDMDGDVTLGYFYGPETGELTGLPVHLSQKRHFHTLFGSDTGFDKTVAAERLVVETTAKWHIKSIVFNFGYGYGWRKLVNVPELQGHVDVRQLTNGVRPIRWNPLQVSRNITPEVHWRKVCEVFGGCTGLGASRQLPELMNMLHNVYVRAGVLVDDPFVYDERYRDTPVPVPLLGREPDGSWDDPLPLEPGLNQIQPWTNPGWYKVRDAEEAAACGWPVETRLVDMVDAAKQQLGRWRSRRVGPMHLMVACQQKVDDPELGGDMRGYLQGMSARLNLLLQGQYRVLYAHGPDVPDICDIVPTDWGVTVLEGGAQMDSKMKAFLLGWAGWIIFTDAVVQRMQAAQTRPAHLQLVFEEANKIFNAESGRGHDDAVQGQSTGELCKSLWRDSRKYGVFLHCVTQNPSQLPPGIISSSNNMILTQLKNPKDVDLIMSQLHRSGKGYHDEEWRRYLGSMPIAESICKLGYTPDRSELEPMRIRPLLVDVDEPDDRQLGALLAHWNPPTPGSP